MSKYTDLMHCAYLYIHTNLYDIEVSKEKFFRFLWKYNKSTVTILLYGRDSKSLYSIYCYKDGCVRFTFQNNEIERKRSAREEYPKEFEKELNHILKKYLKTI